MAPYSSERISLVLFQLMPSENCYNALTKMSHCSLCKGVPNAKVCHGFCLNVMKGCLAFHSELDTEWNAFVGMCSSPFLTYR
jgi:hypothetical protein